MTGSLKATVEIKTPKEYAPETFDIVRVETGLTKTEGVIDRGAKNINSRDTVIEGTTIGGERMIVEISGITGTRTGTNNKGVDNRVVGMTVSEDFNEGTAKAVTNITDENQSTTAERRTRFKKAPTAISFIHLTTNQHPNDPLDLRAFV